MVNSVKKNPFNTFSENRVFQIALPPRLPPLGLRGDFCWEEFFFTGGKLHKEYFQYFEAFVTLKLIFHIY